MFDVALPESALASLAHPYFTAQLYGPIFGNLTPMHQALDDIAADVDPPDDVLREFETVARSQTAAASALHDELDTLANRFAAFGSSVSFYGAPPRRVFPDSGVPAFEPVHAFVVADDAQAFRDALSATHFSSRGDDAYRKQLHSPSLIIDVGMTTDLASAIDAGAEAPLSNRRAALQSIRRNHRRAGAQAPMTARVVVHALSTDALLVALTTRLGRRAHDVGALFDAFSCIDVPAKITEHADPEAIGRLAAGAGVTAPVRDGLAVLAWLLGDASWATRALRRLPESNAGPHPLEWARYGPHALSRTPELRAAFLWLLSLMSVPTASRKARFIGRSLRSRGHERAPLTSVATRALRGLRSSSAPKTTRELCYWVESAK
jgi:hypothetical protein